MDVQAVNVQVIVQLWQILLGVFMSSAGLLTVGYGAARTFVGRKECIMEHASAEKKWDELYTLLRQTQKDVEFIKGQMQR